MNEIVWLSLPQIITKALDQAKGNSAQLVWPKMLYTLSMDECVCCVCVRECHQLARRRLAIMLPSPCGSEADKLPALNLHVTNFSINFSRLFSFLMHICLEMPIKQIPC